MKVRDFMVTPVITVKGTDSIKTVMKTLVTNKIGGVPIVDDNDLLVGIVSDGDILRNIKPTEGKLYDFFTYAFYIEKEKLEGCVESIKDRSIMTIAKDKRIYSVNPDDSMEKVLDIFSKHDFKKLPVIYDDKKVVGIVSKGDVLRYVQTKIIEKL